MTPPEPSRMVEVTWVSAAISTSGAALPRCGIEWCSATQKRLNPSRSAACATAIVSRTPCACGPSSGLIERSRIESGTMPADMAGPDARAKPLALVAANELGGEVGFADHERAGELHARHLAVAAADEPHRLAEAAEAAGPGDPSLVRPRQADLGDLGHGVRQARRGDHHPVADRHEVARAPDAPPAAGPVGESRTRRAAVAEALQDRHDPVLPR